MRDLQRREQVLASAVAAGKIPESRKDHYTRLWDANPERTEQLLALAASVPAHLLADLAPAASAAAEAASEEQVTTWTHELFPETARELVVMDGEVIGTGYATPPEQRAQAKVAPPVARTSPPERGYRSPPSSPAAAISFSPDDVKAWSRMLFPDAPKEGDPLPLIVECND
jgi:hypothetical protein